METIKLFKGNLVITIYGDSKQRVNMYKVDIRDESGLWLTHTNHSYHIDNFMLPFIQSISDNFPNDECGISFCFKLVELYKDHELDVMPEVEFYHTLHTLVGNMDKSFSQFIHIAKVAIGTNIRRIISGCEYCCDYNSDWRWYFIIAQKPGVEDSYIPYIVEVSESEGIGDLINYHDTNSFLYRAIVAPAINCVACQENLIRLLVL